MEDSDKRLTLDEAEKLGELRASIKFGTAQLELLRKISNDQAGRIREESWAAGITLSALVVLGCAQVYYSAGSVAIGMSIAGFALIGGLFFFSGRRRQSKARDYELMRAELELHRAISEANEAIREARSRG